MLKSQKWLWVIIILVLLVGLLFSFAAILNNQNNNKVTKTVESSPLTISDPTNLPNVLLNKQYDAIYFELSSFIQQRVDSNAKTAEISNETVQDNGNVTFTVKVDSHQTSFGVSLDRSNFNQLGVSIPQYNYQKTLSVY